MRNIHIVSHTHWDREWYRPFQLFRLKLVHLIDGILDLLDADPQFKYFMLDGQTIVLDDYLAMRPEKEAILRKHIQDGRILIGPWHILPDMFLVGPESHIRNLLQGDRTARKFGPKMMVGYIPDPFGQPGQVPQILRGFGIDTACLWRGLDDQPAEFWWQSPDGSQVLMAYLRDSYSNGTSLPANNLPVFVDTLNAAVDSLAAHSNVSDYLVMYGTDHMDPPPDTSRAIAHANKKLIETRVLHSTLPKFVEAIQSDIKSQKLALPIVTGELRACRRMHLLPGVLSTRMWIKQRNQFSENLLTKWAEPFSVFQELVTGDGQSPILDHKSEILLQTWRLLMENHPHDSICGCSIDQVHEEMKVRFDQVDQIGEELTRQSLEILAEHISTGHPSFTIPDPSSIVHGSSSIIVFNPTSSPRTDVVNTAIDLPSGMSDFELLDEQGNSLPHQAIGRGGQEIINMELDSRGLQSAFGSISDGRAAGMTIQNIQIHKEGSQVFIDAIMQDGGEPNLAAWQAGRSQIDEFFTDPTITNYHVRARSSSSAQIIFIAPEIPGFGYRTLWLRLRPYAEKAPLRIAGPLMKILLPLAKLPFLGSLASRKNNPRPPYRIENEFFLLQAKPDGRLTLLDKRDGRQYTGLNAFLDGGDCGDEYNYSPPALDRFVSPHLKRVIVEQGSVQQTMTLELELNTPAMLAPAGKSRSKKQVRIPIVTTITLANAIPRLDIRTTLDNNARDHRLRVHFPAPFTTSTSIHDGHFEVVERKIGLPAYDDTWVEKPRAEVPQRAFTDVSDGSSGLMVAVRGLPEVEVLQNPQGNAEIALTLLRCVGWLSRDDFSARQGHAGPFMETPGAQMPGKWTFDYSIIPHTGNWQSACWQAYAFEIPLRAVTTGIHSGDLPPTGSFLETTPASFVISAVKSAEDGRGWIVRGYNASAEAVTAALKPWKPFKKVELVNLAEQTKAILHPDKAGRVTIPVAGHQIVSVLFHDNHR